jgi:DNA invertase Pin-like site-specific DNA recombinase
MSKAVGYTRLSQQSDTSIKRQKRHIREYAEEHALDLSRIYDDGESSSGFSAEREQYQRLRSRIETAEIGAVIINDKRRLARDIDEVMRLIPDLRTTGTELHTYEDGQLDLSDPMRAAIEILQAAAAHEEKMKEIQRAIDAVEERLSDPETDHGRPRFGMEYDSDGRQQVPGENFDEVSEILDRRDRGDSYREIAKDVSASRETVRKVCSRQEWYEARGNLSSHPTVHEEPQG